MCRSVRDTKGREKGTEQKEDEGMRREEKGIEEKRRERKERKGNRRKEKKTNKTVGVALNVTQSMIQPNHDQRL